MPPRTPPIRGPEPDLVPGSLPQGGPDLLPDDLRRNDQPDVTPVSVPPDALPPNEPADEVAPTDTRPDGGVAQHPIHDEDQEDLEPDDYEQEIDEVADDATRRGRAAEESAGGNDEFTSEELGPRSIPPRRK